MNRGQSFIAYAESSKLVQLGDATCDESPGLVQIAAVHGSASGNLVLYAALLQRQAVRTATVSTVGLDRLRLFQWSPELSSNRLNAINQRQSLCDVMPVGLGDKANRHALRVDEEVVLAALLAAVGWVRSTFSPRCTARTDELSATTRKKSSLSAPRSLSSRTRCNLRHTPAFCQARTRRQQVMPEPHRISCGNISHGIPDCKTNRMPVRMRRLSNGLRPGCVLRRCLTGCSGCTISRNSSLISSRAILPRHDSYRRVAMTLKIPFC
jgi:hypothetical protein